jgi:uncharacterized protein with von Willebrand factor type A (vWA) domain
LYERLRAAGFSDGELAALRALIDANARTSPAASVLRAITQGELAMEHLVNLAAHNLAIPSGGDPARTGYLAMRLLDAARVPRAETDVSAMRSALRGALGQRGDALADVLGRELEELRRRARDHVRERLAGGTKGPIEERPFALLTPEERKRMERHVRELAERLLGRAAVRARHARRGRLDMRRTLRGALRTGGVPMRPVLRTRSPQRPKLVMLCDVSESMHATARFMLQFVHAVQRLFRDARSFVFVSDVAEATQAFRRGPVERAIELAYSGGIVSVADNSHYAHAFRQLLAEHAEVLDRRTTLLVLGDGRTNHFDPGEAAFRALTSRAQRVVWLTPEPESAWASGDSALLRYAEHVDHLLPVHDLPSLRVAARTLLRFERS